MTTKTKKTDDVVLTADDERLIERYQLDRAAFIEVRRQEQAQRAAFNAPAPAAEPNEIAVDVVLTADDERMISRYGLDREAFIACRAEELALREFAKR